MIQTLALFLDSYRELNSKKLFWITVILSGLVVLVFLGVGINSEGVTTFGHQWHSAANSSLIEPSMFYRTLFMTLGVDIWLTFGATILALISTGSIFPDLITGGSIDLYLSKPISRLRLFLTKYLTGLMFVGLQVAVFSAASILVLRVRGGAWFPGIFVAVPAVLLFYSYLFCFCVLVGVATRSPIASILLTTLFWCVVFSIHIAEVYTLNVQAQAEIVAARLDRQVAQAQAQLNGTGFKSLWQHKVDPEGLAQLKAQQQSARNEVVDSTKWPRRLYVVKTLTPKTSETVDLMQRWLISASEMKGAGLDKSNADDEPRPFMFGPNSDEERAKREVAAIMVKRPVSWVVGTSLGFEAVVLALAAWLFCRRDY